MSNEKSVPLTCEVDDDVDKIKQRVNNLEKGLNNNCVKLKIGIV